MTMKNVKPLIQQYAHINLVDFTNHLNPGIIASRTILISNNWPEGQILELAANGEFHSFLNSQNKNFESELLAALKIHDNPREFLERPLPTLFKESPNALILPFHKKEDKPLLLSQIDPFLSMTGSRIVQEHSRILFEELFMNAVFDAPAEAKKLGLPSKKKRCELTLAYDHEKLVISCLDTYGSLNPLKMVTRIRDIYNHGTKDIINLGQRKGGAGIGCSLLHHYSSSMIIAAERGICTRVTCSVPIKISQKHFYSLGKNLQIINLTPSGGNHGE
jgi:hypothetical protein